MGPGSPQGQEGSLPHRQTDFRQISDRFLSVYLAVAARAEAVIISCHLLETRVAAAPSDTLQLTEAFSPKTRAPGGFTKTMQPI